MSIDTSEAESPGWWVQRLARKLTFRYPRLQLLHDRFRGDGPLPEGAEDCREAYRGFQRKARTNFAELVVEAVRERMAVTGISTAVDSDLNDDRAMAIWDGNGLNVDQAELWESMLTMGDSYTITGPPDEDDPLVPIITAEDPRQVVTEHDPRRQRRILAALKMFHDDVAGRDLAYLYLPGETHVAFREVRHVRQVLPRFSASSWDWDQDLTGPLHTLDGDELPGLMPVVRFRNHRGWGEFETHTDVLDRIDHQVLQRLVIVAMQAYRQRALKNAPTMDEQGNVIDYSKLGLLAGPGELWRLPPGVDLWESDQADLNGILAPAKADVEVLAAVTRTPMSYMMPDGANQSAEGASFQKERLIFKTEDRLARGAEGLRDTMANSFRWLGDEERAKRAAIQITWASPERRSLQEKADASSKISDLPFRTKAAYVYGFTPGQIDVMESERAADALLLASTSITALPQPSTGTAAPATAPAPASASG